MNIIKRAGQFSTGILFLALASGLILTGCNDDESTFSDIIGTSPAEVPASSGVTPPEWSELQKAVPLATAQLEPMRESYNLWQSNDSRREGTMDFLQQSQNMLEHDQFLALVVYLGDRVQNERGVRRAAMGTREDRPRGPRGDRHEAHERGHGGKPGGSLNELADELGLTAEQKEQLQATFAAHREEMATLHDQLEAGSLTHEELRAAQDALRAENHEAMVATLTDEQAAAFAASHAAHRIERLEEHRQRFEDNDNAERKIAFLTDVLDLDDAQAEKLATIFAEHRAAQLVRMEEDIVAAGSNHGTSDRSEHWQAMQEARESMNESIESLLNADQLEVYDALQKLHGTRGSKGAPGRFGAHGSGPHGRR